MSSPPQTFGLLLLFKERPVLIARRMVQVQRPTYYIASCMPSPSSDQGGDFPLRTKWSSLFHSFYGSGAEGEGGELMLSDFQTLGPRCNDGDNTRACLLAASTIPPMTFLQQSRPPFMHVAECPCHALSLAGDVSTLSASFSIVLAGNTLCYKC